MMKYPRKYKHLFFDLDNTLFDFDSSADLALRACYTSLNLAPVFGSYQNFICEYTPHNLRLWDEYKHGLRKKDEVKYGRFRLTFEAFGIADNVLADKMAELFLVECSNQNILVDGAIGLLERLKPYYAMHIISNGFIEAQHYKLKVTGLRPFFNIITLSEQAQANKPSAEIFKMALMSANARKSESLMIGDNYEADIEGAIMFGIDQIWFRYSPDETEKPATYTVNSLDEIADILL